MKIKIRKYESSKGIGYIFVNENWLKSILADIFTILVIAVWMLCLYLNYQYLGDSLIVKMFIITILIIIYFAKMKSRRVEYDSKEQFIEDIKKELE